MANPRPTIYTIPTKHLPKRAPKEKDLRLWKKNKTKRGIKK